MPPKGLSERLARIRDTVADACVRAGRDPRAVRIVAITKGHPAQAVAAALEAGLRDIGENRVQEALVKFGEAIEVLVEVGARTHMVGHLQRNKVGDAVRLFDWVQSVDSVRLGRELSKRGDPTKPMQVLIEVNAAGEEQKYGFRPEAAVEGALAIADLPAVEVRGLMAMGPWTTDAGALRRTFRTVRRLFEDLGSRRAGAGRLDTLSMGMSGDYRFAVEEGSTMIRIGTALFGERG